MRDAIAVRGLDRKRSRIRDTAAPILARQIVEEAQAPAGSWAKTVKGTLKRWTTSGSDSTGSSTARQRGKATQKEATKQRRRSMGEKSRTAKQTSGETRTGGAHDKHGKPGRFYWNITGFPFPLGPLLSRRTIRYEVSYQDSALCIANVSSGTSCGL